MENKQDPPAANTVDVEELAALKDRLRSDSIKVEVEAVAGRSPSSLVEAAIRSSGASSRPSTALILCDALNFFQITQWNAATAASSVPFLCGTSDLPEVSSPSPMASTPAPFVFTQWPQGVEYKEIDEASSEIDLNTTRWTFGPITEIYTEHYSGARFQVGDWVEIRNVKEVPQLNGVRAQVLTTSYNKSEVTLDLDTSHLTEYTGKVSYADLVYVSSKKTSSHIPFDIFLQTEALDPQVRAQLAALSSFLSAPREVSSPKSPLFCAQSAIRRSVISSFLQSEAFKAVLQHQAPLEGQFKSFGQVAEFRPSETKAAASSATAPVEQVAKSIITREFGDMRVREKKVVIVGLGPIGCEVTRHLIEIGVAIERLTLVDLVSESIRPDLLEHLPWLPLNTSSQPLVATIASHLQSYASTIHPSRRIVVRPLAVADLKEIEENPDGLFDQTHALVFTGRHSTSFNKSIVDCAKIPWISVGTEFSMAHAQTTIPDCTAEYASVKDDPWPRADMGHKTHTFPTLPTHALKAATMWYTSLFIDQPEAINQILAEGEVSGTFYQFPAVERWVLDRSRTIEACVQWGWNYFHERFVAAPKRLVAAFAEKPEFWSGNKRKPTPLSFDLANPRHVQFVAMAAHLRAKTTGIHAYDPVKKPQFKWTDFVDASGAALKTIDGSTPSWPELEGKTDTDGLRQMAKDLMRRNPDLAPHEIGPNVSQFLTVGNVQTHYTDEELVSKWLFLCGQLFSEVYKLGEPTPQELRRHAGLINTWRPPCLAISALASWELCKLLHSGDPRTWPKGADLPVSEWSINLATSRLFSFSHVPPKGRNIPGFSPSVTYWDKLILEDMSIGELLDHFTTNYPSMEVTLLSVATSLIYASWLQRSKDRLQLRVSEIAWGTQFKVPKFSLGGRYFVELMVSIELQGDLDESIDILVFFGGK